MNAIEQAKQATSAALTLIMEIRAETVPGLCPWCDRPLPKTPHASHRKWKRCRRRECKRAYQNAYYSAWRAEQIARGKFETGIRGCTRADGRKP